MADCPYCGSSKVKVKGTIGGFKRKRYRECIECGKDYLTVQIVRVKKGMDAYMQYLKDIGEISQEEYEASKD